MDILPLTADQTEWVMDRLRGPRRVQVPPEMKSTLREYLTVLVRKGRGMCSILELPLRFDKASRTTYESVRGQHPLSVSLDHVSPGSNEKGHQLICHFLNVVKTNLPPDLFDALVSTPEFQMRKQFLQQQFETDPGDMSKLLFVWKHGRLS